MGVPPLPPAEPAIALELDAHSVTYRKDPRGRKPKGLAHAAERRGANSADLCQPPVRRAHSDAGRLSFCAGSFLGESVSGWGAAIDLAALSHGPVGCGLFTGASRLSLPGFVQGVESFAAIHACTDLNFGDLDDGGDMKLAQALDELSILFPLAKGFAILNEDPIALIDANVKGVAKEKARSLGRLILPLSCESIRVERRWVVEAAATLKAAANRAPPRRAQRYDVALPFYREASGLVWIVSKLLREIGLTPVHEVTGSSVSDMGRISGCKLVVGFAESLDAPPDRFFGGFAGLLNQWFGTPIQPACFAGPAATDASLRAIAAHFGPRVRDQAERVIAANRKKVEAIVARYRSRLEGRLAVHFTPMSQEQLEPYRLLGLRIGDASGWTAKTGARRTPRLACDAENPSEKAVDSYIRESRPDLVLHFERDEYEWRKRGQNALSLTPLFDRRGNAYWAYDGFELFAAALDHALNTPWRKLLKPPWRRSD
ncbi:nitrogenase component 1 [Methylocella silvestris]|uniref:nitrogenase component 1 n=1 Tax=Methylocella silvestris TaxID=199596 RepID=UPI0002D476AA|nr:nitrogenase component 1 [Methylocella silvestris]